MSEVTNTDLFEELLIEELRKYEHLWVVKSNKFKDTERANNSWKEISRTLSSVGIEKDETACKKKWKYLRDHYMRLRARDREARSGDGRSKPIAWKYFQTIAFIEKASTSNETLSSPLCSSFVEVPVEDENQERQRLTENAENLEPMSKRRKRTQAEDTVIACMETWMKRQDRHDDCLAFGNHVTESLRNLTPPYKSKVKMEIQRILFKYEEMQLHDEQVHPMQRELVNLVDNSIHVDTDSRLEYCNI